MTRREIVLAACVALVLGGFGVHYIVQGVSGAYASRRNAAAQVQQEIEKTQVRVDRGRQAQNLLDRLRKRALAVGTHVNRSHTRYQAWLLREVAAAGLEDAKVQGLSQQPQRGGNYRLSYKVTARGTLGEILSWWKSFYSVGRMHQMRSANLMPIPESKQLTMVVIVEAFGMPGASDQDVEAVPEPAQKLLEDCVTEIVNRNFFGPPNQPPVLNVPSVHSVVRGSSVSIKAEAKDPDPLDQVTYALDEAPDGAKLDAKTGVVQWKPQEVGSYRFVLSARDDGAPPRTDSETIEVKVTDPPPPAPESDRKPRQIGFDHANQAFFCGTTAVGDARKIWFDVRTTGALLVLAVGDIVDVGSISGQVSRIDEREAELELDGRTVTLRLGDALGDVIKDPSRGE